MTHNMKVLVINLDRRPDRMTFMSEALHRLDVPYARIPAVDAYDPANDWLTEGRPARITGIRMTRGEHAVHASHCLALAKAREQDLDAVIVLEDDAVLSDDFNRLLGPSWIPDNADIIKLESYYGEIDLGPVVSEPFSGRRLRRMYSIHLGCAGYLVTRSGLEALEKELHIDYLEDPIDSTIFDSRSSLFRTLNIYQVEPAMVIQAEFIDGAGTARSSDLAAQRAGETNYGAAYGDAFSLQRRLRRAVNRLRSRIYGRRRMRVYFRFTE